jgi:O-antigen ligase
MFVLHRYPFAAIAIWLLLSPFLTFTPNTSARMVYWVIHRALPPATLIVMGFSAILRINRRKMPKFGIAELGMLGYVVASILSIYVLNSTPQATFYQFYDRVISPMFLYLIVRSFAPNHKDVQRLIPIILFVAVSQSIFGLLSWSAPGLLPKEWLSKAGLRTTGSLVNTTVYTTTLIFSALILLQSALTHRFRVIRNIFVAVFYLALVLVFLSFSRGAWLGAIVVLIGLAFLYPRFVSQMSVGILIISLLFGAALLTRFSWVADWTNERLFSAEAENSAFSRLPVFYAGMRMFSEKPFFGWGYGNFDLYDRQFYVPVENVVADTKDHASHNFFLTLLAEQGAVGFLLFISPLIYWLGQTLGRRKLMYSDGFIGLKFPLLLWLAILNIIIQINFSNSRVVFGWGIWWLALGLIASMIHDAPQHANEGALGQRR